MDGIPLVYDREQEQARREFLQLSAAYEKESKEEDGTDEEDFGGLKKAARTGADSSTWSKDKGGEHKVVLYYTL